MELIEITSIISEKQCLLTVYMLYLYSICIINHKHASNVQISMVMK